MTAEAVRASYDAAAAQERWQRLRSAGPGVHLSDAARTLDGEGTDIPMDLRGVYHRTRALVLSREVHALVLVVRSDELLYTGLPLEWVDSVTHVDRALVSERDPAGPLPETHAAALERLFAGWTKPHRRH